MAHGNTKIPKETIDAAILEYKAHMRNRNRAEVGFVDKLVNRYGMSRRYFKKLLHNAVPRQTC